MRNAMPVVKAATKPGDLAARIMSTISLDIRTLGHPVNRVTIEAAAARAGVSSSTVANQAGSTERFRQLLQLRLIERMQVRPGHATWDALHQALRHDLPLLTALSEVCVARISEVRADRAIPFVLGGFTGLDIPEMPETIERAILGLGRELTPLLMTVLATHRINKPGLIDDPNVFEAVAMTMLSGAIREHIAPPQYNWVQETIHGPADILVIALSSHLGVALPDRLERQ